jgi:hypothetical protein
MGSDPHFSDPLGHLQVTQQEWLEAIKDIKSLGLPLVACGGGGYNMSSVIRMWSSAILALSDIDHSDEIPGPFAEEFGTPRFSDPHPPGPAGRGKNFARVSTDYIRNRHLKEMPTP